MSEFDGLLILDFNISFNLQIPNPMPAYLNPTYICECSSRLFFLTMHWIKTLPAFQLLR